MLEQKAAESLADTYLEKLTAGDLQALVELYAEDGSVEDPVGSGVVQGRAAIRRFYQQALAGKPRAERSGSVRCCASEMVFPFVVRSEAGGHPIAIEIIDHFRVDDAGRIVAMRAFWSRDNIIR